MAVLITVNLHSQALLREANFQPAVFYVGDSVELRLVFDLAGPVVIRSPSVIPESDWADIRDVRVEENGKELVVVVDFVSFAPGTRTLPTLELGGLTLKDIKVPTHSILQNAHEGTRNLRGQLLLPGTRLALALIFSFVAMAPFIVYALVRLFVAWIRKSRERFRTGRPARRIRRILKKLSSSIGTMAAAYWYAELTDGLRSYLSARTLRDCRSATTAEIALLPGFTEIGSPVSSLLEVLQEGDLVKFAGRIADDRSLERCLEKVEKGIRIWEKNLHEGEGGDHGNDEFQ